MEHKKENLENEVKKFVRRKILEKMCSKLKNYVTNYEDYLKKKMDVLYIEWEEVSEDN